MSLVVFSEVNNVESVLKNTKSNIGIAEQKSTTEGGITVTEGAINIEIGTGQTSTTTSGIIVTESAINLEEKKGVLINAEDYVKKNDESETGIASYYSKKFHGRKTSSGDKFSVYEYTGAHRDYPYGTLLKITNLANDKSVIIRVNDRGPFSKKRLVDLSPAAFEAIGSLRTGILKVKVETVELSPEKEKVVQKSIEDIITEVIESNIESVNVKAEAENIKL